MKKTFSRLLCACFSLLLLLPLFTACGRSKNPLDPSGIAKEYVTASEDFSPTPTIDMGAYAESRDTKYEYFYDLPDILNDYKANALTATFFKSLTINSIPQDLFDAEKTVITIDTQNALDYYVAYYARYGQIFPYKDLDSFGKIYYGYEDEYASFDEYATATAKASATDRLKLFWVADRLGLLPTEKEIETAHAENLRAMLQNSSCETTAELEKMYQQMYGMDYLRATVKYELTRKALLTYAEDQKLFSYPDVTPVEFDKSEVNPSDYEETKEKSDIVRIDVSIDGKSAGSVYIRLFHSNAPITVENFQDLVSQSFYDGLTFHRVISGFMIQGGDPKGNGSGGSANEIKGEFFANGVPNHLLHERGVVSMARSQSMDSASSQFFIVHKTSSHLDGNYAAFGYVVSGMDVVDAVAALKTDSNDKPTVTVTMDRVVFVKQK